LLILKISNGIFVAKINNGISVAKIAIEYPLLVVSNEIFVTAKLVTDKSVAKKLTTINLYPIFAVLILLLNYFNNKFFFLIYVGCLGQLTRTTTIPHGPLDILQAQEQVRHRGGDRRAHKGSNPK